MKNLIPKHHPFKPRQLYDVYLSAKFIAPDDLAIDQVVFVATGEDFAGKIEFYEP